MLFKSKYNDVFPSCALSNTQCPLCGSYPAVGDKQLEVLLGRETMQCSWTILKKNYIRLREQLYNRKTYGYCESKENTFYVDSGIPVFC